MDALLARLSQLEDQVRSLSELPPIVAQLSSANEAQLSTNARLSSENEALKIALDDQCRSLVELSRKTAPEGHWLCERGKERKGGSHWIWSSEVEKYKSFPITAAAQQPTAATRLRPPSNASTLSSNPPSSFFKPGRLPSPSTASPSSPPNHPLPLQNLAFAHRSPSHHRQSFLAWSPILRLFNPRTFNITSHRRRASPPTLSYVRYKNVRCFLDFWTRLDAISCTGGRSLVYLGSEEGGGMAFRTCLERCVASALGRKKGIETSLSVEFQDGSSREMEFEDDKELKTRFDLRGGAERLVFEEVVKDSTVWFAGR